MTKKSRIIALTLSAAILAGCSGGTEATNTSADTTTTAATTTADEPETTAAVSSENEITTIDTEITEASSLSIMQLPEIKEENIFGIEPVRATGKNKVSEGAILITLLKPYNAGVYGYSEFGTVLKGEDYSENADPYTTFIWGPDQWSGAYAPCFVKRINEYNKRCAEDWWPYVAHEAELFGWEKYIPFQATDLTGSDPSVIYENIDNEIPAAVLVTSKLVEPEVFMEHDGIQLLSPHEWVIPIGYSDTQLRIWSPLSDRYVAVNRDKFEDIYKKMGSQMFIVTEKE